MPGWSGAADSAYDLPCHSKWLDRQMDGQVGSEERFDGEAAMRSWTRSRSAYADYSPIPTPTPSSSTPVCLSRAGAAGSRGLARH